MEWTTKMEGGGTLYLRDDGTYMYLEANRSGEQGAHFRVILQGLHGDQLLGTMSPREEGGLRLSRMIPRSTLGQWGCLPITKVLCQEIFTGSEPFSGENLLFQLEEEEIEQGEVAAPKEEISPLISPLLPDEITPKTQKNDTIWKEVSSLLEEEDLGKIEEKPQKTTEKSGEKPSATGESPLFEPVFLEVEEVFSTEPELQQVTHPERWMADKKLAQNLLGYMRKGEKIYEKVANKNLQQGRILAIPYGKEKPFPLTSIFCLARLQQFDEKPYVTFFFDGQGRPNFPEKET